MAEFAFQKEADGSFCFGVTADAVDCVPRQGDVKSEAVQLD